jgi:hypothetical protein
MKSYLIALAILVGCSTVSNDAENTYRKTLKITHEEETVVGFAALARLDEYPLFFETAKKPELVRISTCHRDVVLDDTGDEFSYRYIPSKGIEDQGSCILQIATFDDKGHHQFGAVDFLDDETLMADIYCNGESELAIIGATVCQARVGTDQVIEFATSVEVFAQETCKKPEEFGDGLFRYSMKEGYCIFLFKSEDGELHRHTTFGYTDIMKR